MASSYPTALDTMPTWADGTSKSDTSPSALLTAADMQVLSDGLAAVQATLGLKPEATAADVAARLTALAASLTALSATVAGLGTTKADLASPALTGTPTAPTATAGTNTTQIATTAFVEARASTIDGGTA